MHLPTHAHWIGSPHPFDLHEAYLDFRSPLFRLEHAPARAELLITADSRHKLWVNGRFIARGPARSYPQHQSVDRLDITPFLKPGDNILAVQVYQPGYSHFAYVHRGAAGLLATLACDGEQLLVSDETWRVRRDGSFAHNVPRVSIYGSGVEVRDMRLVERWTAVDYGDHDWETARVVAPVGSYPWTGMQARAVPLLNERAHTATLIEYREGRAPSVRQHSCCPDVHMAMRTGWFDAQPASIAQNADTWWTPSLAAGECVYWLLDLGRDYTCQVWCEIENACGQEQLTISYAEKIRDGQLVISDPQTHCRVRLTDHFRLRPGEQMTEGFSLRGGRYALIQLTGPTGDGFRLHAHIRVAEYPLKITRPLVTGDPELDAIVTLCERTHHACLQDGFVDSVWRESSQWLGDALPQALIMASMNDDTRPLRQVIEMAAAGAYPDGVLPSVLPGEVHAYAIVDYNFMWVELLALHWRLCEESDFIRSMWGPLIRMLDRFHQDVNQDGLLIRPPGRRLFLDWAPVSRAEPNAIYNLHYLLALQTADQLAAIQHNHDYARRWQGRATALQAAIRAVFWRDARWLDDRGGTTFSQLTAALALLTGSVQPDETAPLLDAIIARSLDSDDEPAPEKMVLASPFMHHYIFEALRHFGREQEVVDIIKLRWGRWVRGGYPTTWENWNVDFPDGSQCHAFSAHPRAHLAGIFGD